MNKLTKNDIINIAITAKDDIDKEITENNNHSREGIVAQIFKRESRTIIKHRCTHCGHLWEKDITPPSRDYTPEQTCPECNQKNGPSQEVEKIDIRFAEGCMILTPIIKTNTTAKNTELSPDYEWADLHRIPIVFRNANTVSTVISPQGIFCVQTQNRKIINTNNSYSIRQNTASYLPGGDKAVAAMFEDSEFTEFIQKVVPDKDINGNDLKIEKDEFENFIISVNIAFKTLKTQRKKERVNSGSFVEFEPKTPIGAIIDRFENDIRTKALQNEPSNAPHMFYTTEAIGNKISGVLYCGHTRTITTINNSERKHKCPVCEQRMDLYSVDQKRFMVLEKGPQNSLLIRHFTATYDLYPQEQTIETEWREKRIYFDDKKIHLVLPNERIIDELPIVTETNDCDGFKIIRRTQKPDIEWREHTLNEYESSLTTWIGPDLIQPDDELVSIINSTCMGAKGLIEAWHLNGKTNPITQPAFSIRRESYIYQIYAKPIMKQLLDRELWALLKDVIAAPINVLKEEGVNPKTSSIQKAFGLTKRGVDFICADDECKAAGSIPTYTVIRARTVAVVLSIEPSASDETIKFFLQEPAYVPNRIVSYMPDFCEKHGLSPTDVKKYLENVRKNQCIPYGEAFHIWQSYLNLAKLRGLKLTKSKLYPSSLKKEYDKLRFTHEAAKGKN